MRVGAGRMAAPHALRLHRACASASARWTEGPIANGGDRGKRGGDGAACTGLWHVPAVNFAGRTPAGSNAAFLLLLHFAAS